jgi:transposase-like protein
MSKQYVYSDDFKKNAVQKLLTRGQRKIEDIMQEVGVSKTTLYGWRDNFANTDVMKKTLKPHKRSAQEKLKSLIEFDALPLEARGEYLRKNGLHEEHLIEWRNQIERALSPEQKHSQGRSELISEQKKNHRLEKELLRKDKALAEASALLILKKKADLIWGVKEEEDE